MRCIADANVLLPLLTEGHAHRDPANGWWEACGDSDVGLSLPVRMALLRLLSNSRVMGSGTLRPSQAWGAVQCLIDDRVSLRVQPRELAQPRQALQNRHRIDHRGRGWCERDWLLGHRIDPCSRAAAMPRRMCAGRQKRRRSVAS